MQDSIEHSLLGDRVTLLQNTFVAACSQGDVEQMSELLEQGAVLDKPNSTGQYPLPACLKSRKMAAIEFLDERIQADDDQAWQRIQLDELKEELSVAPLPANVTYEQLAERFRTDRDRLESIFDGLYGAGQYEIMFDLAVSPVGPAKGKGSVVMALSARFSAAVGAANRSAEKVIAYAGEAVERLVPPRP